MYQKNFVVKGKMADDSKFISNNIEFVNIIKMSVDIKPLDFRIDGGRGRYDGVSGYIRA